MKLKTITIIKEQWHPIFVIDTSPDVYDTLILAEIDNEQLEEYRSLVDEFILLQNKLESMFKRMTE